MLWQCGWFTLTRKRRRRVDDVDVVIQPELSRAAAVPQMRRPDFFVVKCLASARILLCVSVSETDKSTSQQSPLGTKKKVDWPGFFSHHSQSSFFVQNIVSIGWKKMSNYCSSKIFKCQISGGQKYSNVKLEQVKNVQMSNQCRSKMFKCQIKMGRKMTTFM